MKIKNTDKNKMSINEADYRAVSKFNNDNFNYDLKIDMANQIVDDISDNVYTLSNKLEAIEKIATSLGLDISSDIAAISNAIYNIFENGDNWYNICYQFEKLN